MTTNQSQEDLPNRFEQHLSSKLPFVKDAKILIACSGGLDSIALVHLCKTTNLEVSIAHCNFNLRGEESDGDQRFVVALAKELKIPCYINSFDTNQYVEENQLSIQMAARKLRYDWFQELALKHQIQHVFTAHHADDNLETFLINLSRGTGIDGLTGIPLVNGIYVRPLLSFSRKEIETYALENAIKWREDSSNKSTKYLRNKLRHLVVPAFKEVNENVLNNFNTTIAHLQDHVDFINRRIVVLKQDIFLEEKDEVYRIPLQRLKEKKITPQDLYYLFKSYGFTKIDEIQSILEAQTGKYIVSATHQLLKNREDILLRRLNEEHSTTELDKVAIDPNNKEVTLPKGRFLIQEVSQIEERTKNVLYIDKDKLKASMHVRKWNKGDYFYPIGMLGKKKLSKYFKDEKLSLLQKEEVQLLCDGEEIIWIINYRADNRYKITTNSKRILKIIWSD